jgi:phospholipid/cholesterol/gamma-HCH transport system permease protein
MELGALQQTGRIRVLGAMGIDPFLLLVLPRTVAFALASFTLGITFVSVALVVGFVMGNLLGTVQISLWMFLDHVLTAMRAVDFVVFPVKMLSIGSLLALTMCLSGLTALPGDGSARLLPLGFVRGVLAIMLTSVVFSLAA